MDIFFRRKRPKQQPFLSPLAPSGGAAARLRFVMDRLPAVAVPFAAMLAGTVALVLLFGALSRGDDDVAAFPASEEDIVKDVAAAPAAPPRIIREDIAVRTAEELPATDPAETGSILQALPAAAAFVPDVPVAENEKEIARLEEMQRSDDTPVEDPGEEKTASISAPEAPPMRAATTTQTVNLRAGPDDAAQVLAVVPARSAIAAEENCAHWCAVSYDERSGFIYKSFIGYR